MGIHEAAPEEDPVLQEVPVLIDGGSFRGRRMLLLQHPPRPKRMSYNQGALQSSRPLCNRGEEAETWPPRPRLPCLLQPRLEPRARKADKGGLGTHSDRRQAEFVDSGSGAGVGEEQQTQGRCFSSGVADKQRPSDTMDDSSRYSMGVLHTGELHLAPLADVLPFESSFSRPGAKEDHPSAVLGEGAEGGQEEETVKFSWEESQRKKAAREHAFSYLHRRSAEKPWFQLSFRQQELHDHGLKDAGHANQKWFEKKEVPDDTQS